MNILQHLNKLKNNLMFNFKLIIVMKKFILLFACLSILSASYAEEYCNMGFCFELGKGFKAWPRLDENQQPVSILVNKGMFTSMQINKNFQPELNLEEKVNFLKKRLDKAMYEQTKNTTVFYNIKFSEDEENLGMIKAYCLTGLVKMGFGATQYKFFLFERDGIPYCVEFSTPGGTKGFEKAFRALIDSFYMLQ